MPTTNIGFCDPCCPAPPTTMLCACEVSGLAVDVSGYSDCQIIIGLQQNDYSFTALNRSYSIRYTPDGDPCGFSLVLGTFRDCGDRGLQFATQEIFDIHGAVTSRTNFYIYLICASVGCIDNGDGTFTISGDLLASSQGFDVTDGGCTPPLSSDTQTRGFSGTISSCDDEIVIGPFDASAAGWPVLVNPDGTCAGQMLTLRIRLET